MINDYEEITGKIVNILAYQAVITAQGENYTGEKDWALNKLTELINQQLQKAREEERERIRQFLRGLHLLDYYCKCDDIGHVLAMPRKDYDRLISELDQDKALQDNK